MAKVKADILGDVEKGLDAAGRSTQVPEDTWDYQKTAAKEPPYNLEALAYLLEVNTYHFRCCKTKAVVTAGLGYDFVVPEGETDWATPCLPFGGWLFLPKTNDGVWVAFEAGDINRPVWLGFWSSKVDPPPEGAGKDVRVLQSRAGHRIEFGDAEGSEYVKVVDEAGSSVLLDSAGGLVAVESKGDVTVKAAGKAKVEAQKAIVDAQLIELAGAEGGVVTTGAQSSSPSAGDSA